jgi:hypothetical protein
VVAASSPTTIKERLIQQPRREEADNVKTWRNEHQALVEEADVDQESATNEHNDITELVHCQVNVDETGLRTSPISTTKALMVCFLQI